jgi:hypothetical protein
MYIKFLFCRLSQYSEYSPKLQIQSTEYSGVLGVLRYSVPPSTITCLIDVLVVYIQTSTPSAREWTKHRCNSCEVTSRKNYVQTANLLNTGEYWCLPNVSNPVRTYFTRIHFHARILREDTMPLPKAPLKQWNKATAFKAPHNPFHNATSKAPAKTSSSKAPMAKPNPMKAYAKPTPLNSTRVAPFIFVLLCFVLWREYRVAPIEGISKTIGNSGGTTRGAASPPKVPPLFQKEYDKIDNDYDEARCERYGYSYSAKQKPRRIFFGAMVADEHRDVLRVHATEAYNVYHVAALVESNSTHMNTPRKLRWYRGSSAWKEVVQSQMFGSETRVAVDYWLEDLPKLIGMDRECTQRGAIVNTWIKEGMTSEDVGVMADVDEIVSRDFLRAVQVCDIPQFRPGQDCIRPKLVATGVSFESSPECIKHSHWYHPDIISGQCIDGVGDPTGRVVPQRKVEQIYGERTAEFGGAELSSMREEIQKSGLYPLFNGADIRLVPGGELKPAQRKGKSTEEYQKGVEEIWGVAFHLHNFFDDVSTLRNKYFSYGHGQAHSNDTLTAPLSQLGADIDVVVRCARNLPNSLRPAIPLKHIFEGGFSGTRGNKPIFFLNETYRRERHATLVKIVAQDEKVFGSEYTEDGRWVGNNNEE